MNLITFARGAALAALLAFSASCATSQKAPGQPHNVILFVADGLRYGSVTPETAPALAAVRDEGVDFTNSHSVYPTITTVNASAIATGHLPGDTGNFGNTIFVGDAMPEASYARIAPLEDDAVLAAMNARFGGNYLSETSLIAAARAQGFSVAALGKEGPAAIQDVTGIGGGGAIIIDSDLGSPGAPPLPQEIEAAMQAAGVAPAPPPRGLPNIAQQKWFASIVSKVLLPRFKAAGKPFVIVYWSADPDAAQHAQQDSPGALTPGINGPTPRAALAGVSDALGEIRAALAAQGLAATTDLFVTADHGFSTVAKQSRTSPSAAMEWRDFPAGELPYGFLAVDLAQALNWKLFDPAGFDVALDQKLGPRRGSALIGPDREHPRLAVAANGGSDEIWLMGDDDSALAARIVDYLTKQDYTAAIFVDDKYGAVPGALPLSAIGLEGAARTPRPAIIVSFRSWSEGCDKPLDCTIEIADTSWKTGGGIHGALHRGDTRNFMAAIGPDFKTRFDDPTPIGNADIAPTLAHILGLDIAPRGALRGRVITESLKGGGAVAFTPDVRRSAPAANGFVTTLDLQRVGAVEYYDAAGAPGRAVGLRKQD
jgi:arylsulfatase A-like enzyme